MNVDETLRRAAKQLNASLGEERIPDVPQTSRRGWLVLVLGAVVTLVVVGGIALFTREGSSAPVGFDPLSSTTSTTELPPADDRVRYVNDEHGFEVTYPADWYRADAILAPALTSAFQQVEEVLSLGTYPLRPGASRCPHVPENALLDLGPEDVLISIVLGGGMGDTAWPDGFGLASFLPIDDPIDAQTCIDRPDLDARWGFFSLDGRGVQVFVALGDTVDRGTQTETWRVLDSFTWTGTSPTTTMPGEQAVPVELEPLAEDTGRFVYLTTDTNLTVIDIDRASVTVYVIPELAPGDPQYRVVRRGDLLAFYGHTPTDPAVFALDPERPQEPILVDEAWFFIPSADDERLWLAILDPNSPDTVRALAAVREVTLDGTITVDDVIPPNGMWPTGAVTSGLLFQGETTLELWDPATQTMVDSFPGPFPVATWGNRIVSCGNCDELHLIDLDADTRRIVSVPEGVAAVDGYGGAFSPDGRYVAVPASDTAGPITDDTAVSVVLVDFETATARIVPGSRQTQWDYPQVAWSSDSEWIFSSNGGQLLAYRPSDDTAYRVAVELKGPYYGMAAR